MKIKLSQLKRLIREELDILNAESGEVLTVDEIPSDFKGLILPKHVDGLHALSDKDFEKLRNFLKSAKPAGRSSVGADIEDVEDVSGLSSKDAIEALSLLEDEANSMADEVKGDLGVALDLARGMKFSMPEEWAAAVNAPEIEDYYRVNRRKFESKDDALARWLAELMG